MDFNGIKKMLLACFVCFNVYLLSMWFEGRNVVTSSNGSAITIQQQLEERGIRLLPQALATSEGQLPLVKSKKSTVLRQLQYATFGDSVNIQGEQAKHVLERPLSIGIELPKDNTPLSDDILQIIRDTFIEQETYVLQGKSYTHVRYSPLDKMMTFYKVAMNGKPIVDGTAEIRVFFNEQSQIVEYTQTYKENFTEVSAFTPMISAERALQILDQRVETYLPNDSTVLSVDLGYGRLSDLSEMDIYTPVWEVVYERQDGSVRSKLVDAVRGTVMSLQH